MLSTKKEYEMSVLVLKKLLIQYDFVETLKMNLPGLILHDVSFSLTESIPATLKI